MATPTTKQKFSMAVKWQSKDGSWKTAESERSFDVPEQMGEIKVSIVDDDGKQSDVTRSFERVRVETQEDLLALMESNLLLALSAVNYGLDLYARGTIKGPVAAEVEGDGKAIAKLANQIMKSRAKVGKKPISLERAMELAKAQLEDDEEESATQTQESQEVPTQA